MDLQVPYLDMKGVVLAGGTGSRLRPITRIVNKHVLPIYDKPVIYFPVQTLLDAGINEILVISNADHIGKYMELLELEYDADFNYKVQSEPKGIAHAVSLAEEFVGSENFAVILGDNILFSDITNEISEFSDVKDGAKIFLKKVNEPSAYGIATVRNGSVAKLEEKPMSTDSNLAVLGTYLYTPDVFDKISEIEMSDRGEYEITDVNQLYVDEGTLNYEEYSGEWFDVGTPEGLFRASNHIRDNQ